MYTTVAVCFLLLLSTGLYLYHSNKALNDTLESIHEPLKRGESSFKRDQELDFDEPGRKPPLSIVFLGVDARPGERGRTDTIMVMTINPNTEKAYLLSIPRDTRTEIIGKEIDDKINHAYSFGGIDMSINTIEHFLNIPIDYYILVNMNGFVSVIDVVDGISVDVEQNFRQDNFSFQKGTMKMDGKAALAYVRNRNLKGGDFNRNVRQQQIIQSLLDEALSVKSLWRVHDLLDEVKQHARMNLERHDIERLYTDYLEGTKNQERLLIAGENMIQGNIYYFKVSDEERERISTLLREQLEFL